MTTRDTTSIVLNKIAIFANLFFDNSKKATINNGIPVDNNTVKLTTEPIKLKGNSICMDCGINPNPDTRV